MVLNKQIFEIETGKLLVKKRSEDWVELGGYHFFVAVVFCVFFIAFVFVVAVVAVYLFVCLFFLVDFSF